MFQHQPHKLKKLLSQLKYFNMTTGKNIVKIKHEFNSNNGSNGFKGSMKVGKRAGGHGVPSGQRPGPSMDSPHRFRKSLAKLVKKK